MRRISLLLMLPTLVISLCAQTSHESVSSTVSKDFSSFLNLSLHVISSPTRWNSHDLLIAGGVLAGTGSAALLDDEAFDLMARNHSPLNDHLEKVFEVYGRGLVGVLVAGTFYGSGLAFENSWLRETGLLLASSLAVSVTTETSLKIIVGRARPYAGLGNTKFQPFTLKSDYNSFPSGHTIVAFTVSTVLAERIDNVWASILLYSAATLSGASRLYSNNHWLSDVVFSGALASFAAHSAVSWYENGMKEDDGSTGLRVIPQTNGVMVVYRF